MPKKAIETSVIQLSPTNDIKDLKTTTTKALEGRKQPNTAPNRFVEPSTSLIKVKNPKQMKMIRQTVSALIQCNHNKTAASRLLNISDVAIFKRLKNYPAIMEQVAAFHEQTVTLAKRELEASTSLAVGRVTGLMMNSQSERIQLDSAIEVLDRSGITKPNTQVQVNVLNDLRKDKEQYNL